MVPTIHVLFYNLSGQVKTSVETSKTRTVSRSGDSETETFSTYYTVFEEDSAIGSSGKRTGSRVVTSTVSKTQTSQQATIIGAPSKTVVSTLTIADQKNDKIASPAPATSTQAVPTNKPAAAAASSPVVTSGTATKSIPSQQTGEKERPGGYQLRRFDNSGDG
jgi:hypothetical protein